MSAGERVVHGIVGVSGVEPVGAALRAGIKNERGVPVQKDRWHLMEPYEGPDKRSRPHPSFGWYNDVTDLDKRRVIAGVIAHQRWEDCLEQGYLCFRPHDHKAHQMPPGRRPWCSGDGKEAHRFIGQKGADDWRTIACPGEDCVYRKNVAQPSTCKPTTRFLFRLEWSEQAVARFNAQTCLVRFASGGWRTYRAILGLKTSLDAAAKAIGLPAYSPLGFRFTLTLTEGTGNNQRYPFVVAAAVETPVDFLVRSMDYQRRVAEQITALPTHLSALDVGDDLRAISGPTFIPTED